MEYCYLHCLGWKIQIISLRAFPEGKHQQGTAMAELLYFNDEVKEWVEDRSLTARDVVQRATRAGYLMPMKEVAREKVLAGITSEMEVAAVLGLVESKRQFSNREFEQAAIDDQSRAAREAAERYEAFGKR